LNASEITLGDRETAGADACDLKELRVAVSPASGSSVKGASMFDALKRRT
jgi:hypothetical protein